MFFYKTEQKYRNARANGKSWCTRSMRERARWLRNLPSVNRTRLYLACFQLQCVLHWFLPMTNLLVVLSWVQNGGKKHLFLEGKDTFGASAPNRSGLAPAYWPTQHKEKLKTFQQTEAGPFQQTEAGPFQQTEAGQFQKTEAGPFQQTEAGLFQQTGAGLFQQTEAGPFHPTEAGPPS
jgi:hypothetical protein